MSNRKPMVSVCHIERTGAEIVFGVAEVLMASAGSYM